MDHGLHYDSAGLVFRVGSPAWRRVGRVLINARVGTPSTCNPPSAVGGTAPLPNPNATAASSALNPAINTTLGRNLRVLRQATG